MHLSEDPALPGPRGAGSDLLLGAWGCCFSGADAGAPARKGTPLLGFSRLSEIPSGDGLVPWFPWFSVFLREGARRRRARCPGAVRLCTVPRLWFFTCFLSLTFELHQLLQGPWFPSLPGVGGRQVLDLSVPCLLPPAECREQFSSAIGQLLPSDI